MTPDIGLVLGILVVAVILFVTERVRVDIVALMVLVTLAVTGLLEPSQAVSGFSNPAVITVWAVFILSGGLSRTGVAGILGRQVLRLSGESEGRLVMVIMLTAAGLSAFMNNVGVAALLLPVVMDIARRTGRAPSRLLIPLAFSSLLGGLMTLIGTPPNILISAALDEHGYGPFSMFDFTPVGAAVVVAGIAYMSLIGRRLLPSRNAVRDMAGREEVDLQQVYHLRERLFVLDIPPDSRLVGMSLGESRVGSALGLNVMGILRGGKLELAPDTSMIFQPDDQLVVQGHEDAVAEVGAREYLSVAPEPASSEDLVSGEVGLAELRLPPKSKLHGKTLREIEFRQKYGVLILALWRDGVPRRTHLATTEVALGDVMLVHGRREALDRLAEGMDFYLSEPDPEKTEQLEERLMSLIVPESSPLVGQTLEESRLGDVFSLGVMAIVRPDERTLLPSPTERLEAGDRLIVKGRKEDLQMAGGLHELPIAEDVSPSLEDLQSDEIGLAEAVLAPRSSVSGKTLSEIHFREKYGFNVLAIMREGEPQRKLRYFRLRFGDALLLHGRRDKLKVLGADPDFLVLTEEAQDPPLLTKAPLAALIMLSVVVSVILGLAPIYIAGVAGAVLMVLTGCLTMDEAYRSIEWQAVFLIAGMLPLGLALQQSGAAEFLTNTVVGLVGDMGPIAVIAGIYLFTALAAQVMPTAAVAILVAPIAIKTANDLGMSPKAMLMAVSLSASASFMSPVAHPANVLIMGPGGYKFIDYIKVGLPLTLVCLAVTLLLLPIFWPLAG